MSWPLGPAVDVVTDVVTEGARRLGGLAADVFDIGEASGNDGGSSDWDAWGHQEMYSMIRGTADPGDIQEGAAAYQQIGDAVGQSFATFVHELNGTIEGGWRGEAADAAVASNEPIRQWSVQLSDAVTQTGQLMDGSGQSVEQARRDVPPPVEFSVSRSLLSAGAGFVAGGPAGGLLSGGADAVMQDRAQEQARTQAVQVMSTTYSPPLVQSQSAVPVYPQLVDPTLNPGETPLGQQPAPGSGDRTAGGSGGGGAGSGGGGATGSSGGSAQPFQGLAGGGGTAQTPGQGSQGGQAGGGAGGRSPQPGGGGGAGGGGAGGGGVAGAPLAPAAVGGGSLGGDRERTGGRGGGGGRAGGGVGAGGGRGGAAGGGFGPRGSGGSAGGGAGSGQRPSGAAGGAGGLSAGATGGAARAGAAGGGAGRGAAGMPFGGMGAGRGQGGDDSEHQRKILIEADQDAIVGKLDSVAPPVIGEDPDVYQRDDGR